MLSCSARRRWSRPVVLVALLALSHAAALAVSVPDLLELLESDVPEGLLLRLVEASGPPPDLTAADLSALWKAGASETLLGRLLPAATPGEDVRTEPGSDIRAYYRDEPDGRQVFILTNLDDDGERLDGRPTSGARVNRVAGRSLPAGDALEPPEPLPPAEYAYPVPAPEPVEEPVRFPSAGPETFVQASPYYGFFYGLPTSHLYPPGSYTHFKLYHQGGRKAGLGHYQLPAGQIFYQPPFPTAGSHPFHRPRRR